MNGFKERHGLGERDAKLRAIDLQYHDLRASHSLSQRVGLGRHLDIAAVSLGITGRTILAVALPLRRPRTRHARRHRCARLARRRTRQLGRRRRLHFHSKVDPVQHRPAEPVLVVLRAARRTPALARRIAEIAAAAWIHRRD